MSKKNRRPDDCRTAEKINVQEDGMSKKSDAQPPQKNTDLIISLAVILVTTLGTNIGLYMHASSQSYDMHKETGAQIQAIQQEMKDFHGRLCAIEERSKGVK